MKQNRQPVNETHSVQNTINGAYAETQAPGVLLTTQQVNRRTSAHKRRDAAAAAAAPLDTNTGESLADSPPTFVASQWVCEEGGGRFRLQRGWGLISING